jgi:cytochrome c oxidase assembly protein subunit 15
MFSLKNPVALWLFSGCLLIFIMVTVGGITRLTGSGLSITEWKLIRGTIPPLNQQEWEEEFDNYKQIPQYTEQNYHFTLEDFKTIYWWEYIHRLIGRIIGIVFIVPFVWFWIKGKISRWLMPRLLLLFGLGALQGFLGWYMVKSGLTDNVRVSHIRLGIHLGMAFLTFGYTFWLLLGLHEKTPAADENKKSRIPLLLLIVVFAQIIYGAFVAGTKAGHIYNTFPKMGDEWIAGSVSYAFETQGASAWINDMSVVQFIHRCLAWILALWIIGYWIYIRRNPGKFSEGIRHSVNFLAVMVVIQFLLGMFTLLYSVPVWLGLLHQAGAFLLFAGAVYHYRVQVLK